MQFPPYLPTSLAVPNFVIWILKWTKWAGIPNFNSLYLLDILGSCFQAVLTHPSTVLGSGVRNKSSIAEKAAPPNWTVWPSNKSIQAGALEMRNWEFCLRTIWDGTSGQVWQRRLPQGLLDPILKKWIIRTNIQCPWNNVQDTGRLDSASPPPVGHSLSSHFLHLMSHQGRLCCQICYSLLGIWRLSKILRLSRQLKYL